jgi:hypothetical protein
MKGRIGLLVGLIAGATAAGVALSHHGTAAPASINRNGFEHDGISATPHDPSQASGIVSQADAEAEALRELQGTHLVASELDDVIGAPHPGNQCLCWLVEVLTPNESSSNIGHGTNYMVEFIDAHTGKLLISVGDYDPTLPTFTP